MDKSRIDEVRCFKFYESKMSDEDSQSRLLLTNESMIPSQASSVKKQLR
jgi:hypothetical protein